jgi:hypothetical protein
MIDLKRYFLILFMTNIISVTKLKQFSETHIARLAANNPGGIYTPILVSATNAYNTFYGSSASQVLQLAVQKGMTSGMNSSQVALLKFIRQKEGTIKGEYGLGSSEYIEAFPGGLTRFDEANLMDFAGLGDGFLSFLTSHSADLPAGIVASATTLLDTFKANRTAQLGQIGIVSGIHTGTTEGKDAMCKQLTYNLLTVARDNLGLPDNIANYFDLSIIANPDDDAIRLKVPPSATSNMVSEGLTALSTFYYKNNSNARLFFSRSANAYTAGVLGVWLEPGDEGNGGIVELGNLPFFNVTNGNATLEGNCSVTQTL